MKEEKLRNAANEFAFNLDTGDLNTNRDTFIAGAEWMKAQLERNAIECQVVPFEGNLLLEPQVKIALEPYKIVKVIIIKE